ncbi:MAG: DMT family transporter [Candidatus Lernaella stagnicola]|nr:DMT family transporter [Candidatus Lernaella stagnicola]
MSAPSIEKPHLVPVALVAAVAAISFAAIFFRLASPTHPAIAAGVRLAVAAVLLLPWTVRAALRGKLRGPLLTHAVVAGLFYGLHFGAWVTSLTMTSIAASVTLVTTTPLLLAVAGVITGRDKPTGRLWLLLALAFAGLLILGGGDLRVGWTALAGDGLALAGAVAMAGYMLTSRRLGKRLDLWAFSGVATAVGAVTLLGGAALCGVPLSVPSWSAFGYLVLAALLPQLVGHTIITWSLRYTKPMVVALAVLGEPVGATILGVLWLGEAVAPWVAVGCVITLAAVGAAIVSHRIEPVA